MTELPLRDTAVSRGQEFPVIQVLRAIAATLVVVLHAQSEIGEIVTIGTPWRAPIYLPIGVDIFFVISGFIMTLTAGNTPGGLRDAARFLFRRGVRIFPMYWIFTTVMLIAIVISPSSFSNASNDWGHIWRSYLLIPHLHPTAMNYEPMLRVGWTLLYELFFYSLFAVSLVLPRSRRRYALWAVLIILSLWGMAAQTSGVVGLYTSTLLLEFVFGMILAETIRRSPRYRLAQATAFLLLAVVAVMIHHVHPLPYNMRGLFAGLPATALIALALLIPARWFHSVIGRFAVSLGDGSYILYLSHLFVIGAVKLSAATLFPVVTPWGGVGLIVVSVVLASTFSQALHYLFEVHVLSFGKHLDAVLFGRQRTQHLEPSKVVE